MDARPQPYFAGYTVSYGGAMTNPLCHPQEPAGFAHRSAFSSTTTAAPTKPARSVPAPHTRHISFEPDFVPDRLDPSIEQLVAKFAAINLSGLSRDRPAPLKSCLKKCHRASGPALGPREVAPDPTTADRALSQRLEVACQNARHLSIQAISGGSLDFAFQVARVRSRHHRKTLARFEKYKDVAKIGSYTGPERAHASVGGGSFAAYSPWYSDISTALSASRAMPGRA